MDLRNKLYDRGSDQPDVGRFALLLTILIVTIGLLGMIGLPRTEDDPGRIVHVLVTLLSGGVLFATIRVTRVSAQHQRWFVASIAFVVSGAIVGYVITDSQSFNNVVPVVWVLLVISAPVVVLKGVLSSESVTLQTILGAVSVYLLLGLALTFVAIAMDGWGGFFETTPRSTAFVYFAFVTITSLGYGDLAPYTDGARMVSVTAAVTSQMYLVIVVARLVAIWHAPKVPDTQQDIP